MSDNPTTPDDGQGKADTHTSKGKLLVEKLNAYRNIILAVAALATAVGSWFKPTDTTATKNSFEWTAKRIEELSANDIKTKEDIVAIRNYLEGYVQAQQRAETSTPAVGPAVPTSGEGTIGLGNIGTIGHGAGSGSGSGFGSGAGGVSRPRPPHRPRVSGTASPAAPTASFDVPFDPLEGHFVAFDSAPDDPLALPELQANPEAVKAPKFEQIAK